MISMKRSLDFNGCLFLFYIIIFFGGGGGIGKLQLQKKEVSLLLNQIEEYH